MVDNRYPQFQSRLQQAMVGRLQGAAARPQPAPLPGSEPGVVGGGLRAGFNELQALSGAAVAAVGKATGSEDLEAWGGATAAKNFAEARQYGRPDLEVPPWREGGGSALPWLAYQVSKQVPQVLGGAAIGAATGGAGLVAGTAARAALTRGASAAAAREAAKTVSKESAKKAYRRGAAAGLFGTGTVQGAGSMYSEAIERGDPTQEDAIRALSLAPIYGAADAAPQVLLGKAALRGGSQATRAKRLAAGVGIGAAVEAPTEGFQTALENTFRPDLTQAEKNQRIVDAALTGAAVGGTLGGAGNIRKAQSKSPTEVANQDINEYVDETTASVEPEPVVAPEAAVPEAPMVGPQQGQGELLQPTGTPVERPYAAAKPDEIIELVERAQATLAAPDITPAQQTEVQATLADLANEVAARRSSTPMSGMSQEELVRQAEDARQRLSDEAATTFEREDATTQLAEVEAEIEKRAAAVPPGAELPGLEAATQEASAAEAQLEGADPSARTARNLARQYIRSTQDEAFAPSKQAERLGLTPYTTQEFEARVDATRTELQNAATAVEQAETTLASLDQQPDVRKQDRAKAQKAVKDARTQLGRAQREANKATQDVRLRDRALQLAEAAGGDVNAIPEPSAAQVGVREPTQDGQEVGARDTEGQGPTEASQRAQEPQTQARLRRQRQREAGITSENLVRVTGTRVGNRRTLEIPISEMRDVGRLADRLQGRREGETTTEARERGAVGIARTRQEARAIARDLSKAAQRGGTDFQDAAARNNIEVAPVAPTPAQPLETPTLQPADIPDPVVLPDQNTTGTGAPTTPAKAAFRPQNIPAAPSIKPDGERKTVADEKAEAPADSPVQAIEAPDDTPVIVPNSPQQSDNLTQNVVGRVSDSLRNMFVGDYLSMAPGTRREMLGWMDKQTIQQRFDRVFDQPWLQRLRDNDTLRKNLIAYYAPLGTTASREFENLKVGAQEKITKLMELSAYGFSYERTWDENTWLQGHPDAEFLKQKHAEARKLYDTLARNGGRKVLDAFADLNRSLSLENQVRRLHAVIDTDFTLNNRDDFDQVVGIRGYERLRRKRVRDPRQMVAELKKDRAALLQIADQMVARKNRDAARAGLTPTQTTELRIMTDMLSETTATVRDEAKFDDVVPYFHKGRFGDYRVSFNLARKQDESGRDIPNEEAERALADALAAQGIANVGVQERGPSRQVFMKFETQQEADAVATLAKRLEQQGVVEPASTAKGSESLREYPESAALRLKNDLIAYINAQTEPDSETGAVEMTRANQLRMIRQTVERFFLETTPANSNRRVLAHRRNVHGYSKDLHRAFVHRWQVGITNSATAITATPRAKLYQGMKAERKTTGSLGENRTYVQNDIIAEMEARDKVEDIKPNSVTGMIRAANHAWYLGLSPAYMAMTVAHVPIITLPRLGAQFGYGRATTELTSAAAPAARALKVLIRQSMNVEQFGDATFTNLAESALNQEFLEYDASGKPTAESQEVVSTLLDLAETGTIDMGGQMRELGRIAEGRGDSRLDRVLRVYGAPGHYSEVYSRLVTGIAAYRLHKSRGKSGDDLVNTVANTIHETMLDYSSSNIARQTGEAGLLGRATPIVLAFQQYSFQVIGMIYREYHKLYTANEPDPARRAEARRFLGGHLAAVTVFAGSMGMPFFAPAARAVEALANTLFVDDNEEPINLEVAYRNFLADTFGKDVGEVLARGAPRAFGVDLSRRLGEQNLLPFSQLLADRRFLLDAQGTADAFTDAALRGLGAPVGVSASLAEAFPALAEGSWAKAAEAGLPVALSSVVKAVNLSERGYTNRSGEELPITPTARDIMVQALGLAPQQKADYTEAANAVRVYQMRTRSRKNAIRNNISTAIKAGDRQATQEWLREAQAFDLRNPGQPILPALARTLTQRYKTSAISEATGLPRGADYKDPAVWANARFGNY